MSEISDLKSQVRRLQVAVAVCVLSTVSFMLMGSASGPNEQFVVKDRNGNERAKLVVQETGTVALILMGADRVAQARLAVTAEGTSSLILRDPSGALTLLGSGDTVLPVQKIQAGEISTRSIQSRSLSIEDASGVHAQLSERGIEAKSIKAVDNEGKALLSLGDGKSRLSMEQGSHRIDIGVHSKGSMVMLSRDGLPIAALADMTPGPSGQDSHADGLNGAVLSVNNGGTDDLGEILIHSQWHGAPNPKWDGAHVSLSRGPNTPLERAISTKKQKTRSARSKTRPAAQKKAMTRREKRSKLLRVFQDLAELNEQVGAQ